MARVEIEEIRIQYAHFGLYRTSAGGDESIIVRRKVGEPTDYMHTKSRKLARQRRYMALASQHYAKLTPSQKAITRHQFEIVQYETGHSKTEEKLLSGRQLFISKDIHSLKTTGKLILLPSELCIMLVDEEYNSLEGKLDLLYKELGEWKECESDELSFGSWLFSQVPPKMPAYRCFGEVENYYDPQLPELQNMTEQELKAYRYHVMLIDYPRHCYAERGGPIGQWLSPGERRSQLFTPYADFNLQSFFVSLQDYPYPTEPPPETGFISIHEIWPTGRPKEPPLAISHFDIHLAEFPSFKWHSATFGSLPLLGHIRYAWVVGFDPPHRPDSLARVEGGIANGLCNEGVEHGNAESWWEEDDWGTWVLNEIPFCAYETRG